MSQMYALVREPLGGAIWGVWQLTLGTSSGVAVLRWADLAGLLDEEEPDEQATEETEDRSGAPDGAPEQSQTTTTRKSEGLTLFRWSRWTT
jgi:hypothetical protein